MKVRQAAITKIKPYDRNPRKNAEAVRFVAASIRAFGFRQPIVVDEEMVIIVGHTRWLAAQEIGMKTVSVHVAEGLSDEEARAYRLDDNKLHEHAQWNPAVLLEELARLSEFSEEELGFTDEEIEKLHQHLDADDGKEIPTVCEIVIECKTGDQLQELEQEFRGRGMACRPLIM